MMRERAGVMTMKSQHVKFIVAFQRQFGFEAFQVATHARHGRGLASRPENHGGVFRLLIYPPTNRIISATVTDVPHVQREMLAPEIRRHDEPLTRAQDVTRSRSAMPLC